MSEIAKIGQAGTLESNDILITVAPADEGTGVCIELNSIVLAQYGRQIRQTLEHIAAEQGIRDVYIKANDRGALDCTIRARALAAFVRAGVIL